MMYRKKSHSTTELEEVRKRNRQRIERTNGGGSLADFFAMLVQIGPDWQPAIQLLERRHETT